MGCGWAKGLIRFTTGLGIHLIKISICRSEAELNHTTLIQHAFGYAATTVQVDQVEAAIYTSPAKNQHKFLNWPVKVLPCSFMP